MVIIPILGRRLTDTAELHILPKVIKLLIKAAEPGFKLRQSSSKASAPNHNTIQKSQKPQLTENYLSVPYLLWLYLWLCKFHKRL